MDRSTYLPPDLNIFSPAKINLFLHITGRRNDGYHDLQSVFRLLDWGDTLNFWRTKRTFEPWQPVSVENMPIELECNANVTASPFENLVIKAAIALLTTLNETKNNFRLTQTNHSVTPLADQLPIIKVVLNKSIPTGAGLGGGSSNAAMTLQALNKLWGLNLSRDALIDIGARVGADVPIFIAGQDSIARGIGEILSPIELTKQSYLLLTPSAHVNTAELFQHPKLRRDCPILSNAHIRQCVDDFSYQLYSPFYNVFESVVTSISKPVNDALIFLRSLEYITNSHARMTGSGSSVFLPYQPIHLEVLRNLITKAPCSATFVNSYCQ